MTYKKYCSICNINYTNSDKLIYYRCFNCREKIPAGESVNNNKKIFTPYQYSLNNTKPSSKIWIYSQSKYLWTCEFGHEFRQTPKNIIHGAKCKSCLPGKIFNDSNSLIKKSPELSQEWDYDKNIFTPKDYTFGSGVKVWWRCHKCNHGWMASIKSRTNKNHSNGCPKCSENNYRSKGEIELLKYIESIYNGMILTNSRKIIFPMELDIYLPTLNLAIEYNGEYWHGDGNLRNKYNKSQFEYHYEKYIKCHNKNIELFYIWESDWRMLKGRLKFY